MRVRHVRDVRRRRAAALALRSAVRSVREFCARFVRPADADFLIIIIARVMRRDSMPDDIVNWDYRRRREYN